MSQIPRHIDDQTVVETCRLMLDAGQVVEVRALGASTSTFRRPHTISGYFDDFEKLAAGVATIDDARGIYITPNPAKPALLARAANRLRPVDKGDPLTSDGDILRRRWLLLDFDPVRPAGISATDLEQEIALERARQVRDHLRGLGWPAPIFADSGNGGHLNYRIDLPADDDGLVKRCLETLSQIFDDDQVKIDRTVFNPSRIWKLYGTMARKGDSTSERPHRLARIIEAPSSLQAVLPEQLKALANPLQSDADGDEGDGSWDGAGDFDLDAWIENSGLMVEGPGPWRSADGETAKRWKVPTCPWNGEHVGGSAYIVQFANGAIAAGCHHNSCIDKNWHDLRDVVEPGWREQSAENAGGAARAARAARRSPIQPQTYANRLIKIGEEGELFHTPGGYASEGYTTFTVSGHRETHAIRSRAFKRHLARKFYDKMRTAANDQAIQHALGVLEGKALFEGAERQVAVRLAEHDGEIWLDLANDKWQAVQFTPDGWKVVDSVDVPVRFIRKRGMLALPTPVVGGNVNELRPLLNLPADRHWILCVAWLVAALRPGFPYPVLVVNGEQGSAKSSLFRFLRALIDPNKVALRRPPKSEEDLMIAASNAWTIAFDNLSGLSPALSDALCVLATGGGLGKRELYSDADETLLDAMRPVMINGIDDLVTRPDLLDRALMLGLLNIPRKKRRSEKELRREFEKIRPRVLGALLDAVSTALRNLPDTELDELPRMADLALWVTAAEPALGWKPGTFSAAYNANRASANMLAIESSPIGPAILGLMHGRDYWSGISRELLVELETHHSDEHALRNPGWPKHPEGMTNALRRIAPNLRALGIEATFHPPRGHKKERIIELEKTPKEPTARAARAAKPAADDSDAPLFANPATQPADASEHEPSGTGADADVPETPTAARADCAARSFPDNTLADGSIAEPPPAGGEARANGSVPANSPADDDWGEV